MWVIEVAELSRIDGSLEGGYKIDCTTQEEVYQVIAELEDCIAEELLTDIYPFHSFDWYVSKVELTTA